MKIYLNSKKDIMIKDFPINTMKIQDTLDKLCASDRRDVTFVFAQTDNPKLPYLLFNKSIPKNMSKKYQKMNHRILIWEWRCAYEKISNCEC